MNDSKPSARRGVRWSVVEGAQDQRACPDEQEALVDADLDTLATALYVRADDLLKASPDRAPRRPAVGVRSEEHTSELQSHSDLVCRLLLEKKKKNPWRSSKVSRKIQHS